MSIKNDSGRNLVASFAAEAPANFETSFTEAYGTQELSSIPIEAGQSKDIKLKVRPPSTVDAGHFPVKVTVNAEDASAKAELALDIVGQPQLQVAGRDGLLSARAVAAQAKLDSDRRHQHRNRAGRKHHTRGNGAERLEGDVRAGAPSSGWCPARTPRCRRWLRQATSRWPATTWSRFRATSRGENASSQFRITVTTSTVWGMAGAGVIGVALLLMLGAVARFGRR